MWALTSNKPIRELSELNDGLKSCVGVSSIPRSDFRFIPSPLNWCLGNGNVHACNGIELMWRIEDRIELENVCTQLYVYFTYFIHHILLFAVSTIFVAIEDSLENLYAVTLASHAAWPGFKSWRSKKKICSEVSAQKLNVRGYWGAIKWLATEWRAALRA